MTIASVTRAAILDLVFLATAWADYAQNDGSGPETTITFAMHEADPGIGGTMSTSEATYGSYNRQDIARSGSGFTRTANSVSPNADVNFPIGTGSGNTLTHFSTGHSWTGGGEPMLWYGTLTPNVPSGVGIRPIILAASTISLT